MLDKLLQLKNLQVMMCGIMSLMDSWVERNNKWLNNQFIMLKREPHTRKFPLKDIILLLKPNLSLT